MDLITYALCHKITPSPTPIDPSTNDGSAQKIIHLDPTFSQPVLGETNLSLLDVQDVYNIDFQFTLSQEEIDELEATLDNAQIFPRLMLNDFILEPVSTFDFPPHSRTSYILCSTTRINPVDFTPVITYLALNISDFTGIFVNKTIENDTEELATKEYVDNAIGDIESVLEALL